MSALSYETIASPNVGRPLDSYPFQIRNTGGVAMNVHIRLFAWPAILMLGVVSAAKAAQPPDVVNSDGQGNTAMGTEALLNVSGINNTAAGYHALRDSSTGNSNTAIGAYALRFNTGGGDNTAVGLNAMLENTTGAGNTALGEAALYDNTIGNNNTAIGLAAMFKNTTGSNNTANGFYALSSNSTGLYNTAFGYDALYTNVAGDRNIAIGNSALYRSTADDNTAIGYNALYSNTSGHLNNAIGNFALEFNTTGLNNNAVGYAALLNNTTGSSNSVQGYFALANNTSGSGNIAIGYRAGINTVDGNSNIFVGNLGVAGDNNTIRIGNSAAHSAVYVAGISGKNVTNGAGVVIDANGKLGVVSSSRRYKKNIRPVGTESERLYGLRPVTFEYRNTEEGDPNTLQYGLVAEEVAESFPELVVTNSNGDPETVAYHVLPTLLLNELQKEHQVIIAQARQLQAMSRELAELRAETASAQSLSARITELERNANRTAGGIGATEVSRRTNDN